MRGKIIETWRKKMLTAAALQSTQDTAQIIASQKRQKQL